MSSWIVPLSTDVWVPDKRVTSSGYAQPDKENKSEKPKHPIGFQLPQEPARTITVDWIEVVGE